MKRTFRIAALFFVLATAAAGETIAPSELQRGDVGWGLSVFAGSEPERFEAEVVLLKVLEPLPDAIFTSPAAVQTAEESSAQLARDHLDRVA